MLKQLLISLLTSEKLRVENLMLKNGNDYKLLIDRIDYNIDRLERHNEMKIFCFDDLVSYHFNIKTRTFFDIESGEAVKTITAARLNKLLKDGNQYTVKKFI